MMKISLLARFLGLLCAAGLMVQGVALANDTAAGVAEVLFVSGDCRWVAADGVARPLLKGQRLPVGARIVTGADGHAYLATNDQGFLSLRPKTVLRIVRYEDGGGQAVDIRLELERGQARVVSGAAAQRAPRGFRMETPLAVIGVRGTDFAARMENDRTQVAVRSGGVVVSPLSDACLAGVAGPCEGSAAVELFAREAGFMVEVRRGSAMPLKLESPAVNAPEARTQRPPGGAASQPADASEKRLEVRREAAISNALGDAALVPAPVPVQTVFWGRWDVTGTANESAQARFAALTAGRELIALNPWFVLSREPGVPVLPRQGQVTLGLAGADALIVSMSGAVLASAQIDNGRLLLDFGQRQFVTSFRTQGGGYTANFYGAGPIHADGTFESYWQNGTTGSLAGAIEPAAQGAGYLFNQPLSASAVATGALRWAR
jgi:hypothetical protein